MASTSRSETSTPADLPLVNLLAVASTVLTQALDLIHNNLTSDDQLVFTSQFIPGSTIGIWHLDPTISSVPDYESPQIATGKHLRHARDHFALLLDSVESPPPFVLNYDTRSRNRPMESSLSIAGESIKECIVRLENVVPKLTLDAPLTLNAVTPHDQTLQSSLGRELWFTALHAVHHWSMIRVIAAEQGIAVEETFGFAPSTLVFRGQEAPLGKARI